MFVHEVDVPFPVAPSRTQSPWSAPGIPPKAAGRIPVASYNLHKRNGPGRRKDQGKPTTERGAAVGDGVSVRKAHRQRVTVHRANKDKNKMKEAVGAKERAQQQVPCTGDIFVHDAADFSHFLYCGRKRHNLILSPAANLDRVRNDAQHFLTHLVQSNGAQTRVSKVLLQAPACFRLDQLLHRLQRSPACQPACSYGGPLMQYTPFKDPRHQEPLRLLVMENIQDHPQTLVDARVQKVRPGGFVVASRELELMDPKPLATRQVRSYFLLDHNKPDTEGPPVVAGPVTPRPLHTSSKQPVNFDSNFISRWGGEQSVRQRKGTPWHTPLPSQPPSTMASPVKGAAATGDPASPPPPHPPPSTAAHAPEATPDPPRRISKKSPANQSGASRTPPTNSHARRLLFSKTTNNDQPTEEDESVLDTSLSSETPSCSVADTFVSHGSPPRKALPKKMTSPSEKRSASALGVDEVHQCEACDCTCWLWQLSELSRSSPTLLGGFQASPLPTLPDFSESVLMGNDSAGNEAEDGDDAIDGESPVKSPIKRVQGSPGRSSSYKYSSSTSAPCPSDLSPVKASSSPAMLRVPDCPSHTHEHYSPVHSYTSLSASGIFPLDLSEDGGWTDDEMGDGEWEQDKASRDVSPEIIHRKARSNQQQPSTAHQKEKAGRTSVAGKQKGSQESQQTTPTHAEKPGGVKEENVGLSLQSKFWDRIVTIRVGDELAGEQAEVGPQSNDNKALGSDVRPLHSNEVRAQSIRQKPRGPRAHPTSRSTGLQAEPVSLVNQRRVRLGR